MTSGSRPYYRPDLARVHHEGFAFHADDAAAGILELLAPVKERGGLAVELGCGSGLLTRHLVDAGIRVIATDASPAMLDLARSYVPDAERIERLTLPDDPIPSADAIISVGHVLNYLPDAASIDRALIAIAAALREGGPLVLDLCDFAYGEAREAGTSKGWIGDGWALVTELSLPAPDRFVRRMAVFMETEDGSWRRDDEQHDNVLIDTTRVPALLSAHGVEVEIGPRLGAYLLPEGLVSVVGTKPALRTSTDRSQA